MTKNDFIKNIVDEITISGSLNIEVKTDEIERIIENEKRNVFRNWRDTVELRYGIVPVTQFRTPEFRASRTIQFPDCVLNIGHLEEMRRKNSLFGLAGDPDFTFGRFMNQDMLIPGNFLSTDAVVYRTIQMSTWDQLKTFNLSDIKHRFDEVSHVLTVLGHDPIAPVFCELYVKAPEEKLFDDPWVQKWMGAKCKLQVAKAIGTFTATTIGGVTVNYNLYTDEANKDLDECKEFFKNLRDADHFFITVP